MNTNKQEIREKDQLLSVRNEQLEALSVGVLRPHGKLWGMDVFSWFKPSVHDLDSTLCSFPFPVIWLTLSADVNAMLNLPEDEWTFSLDSICVYDQADYALPQERIWDIDRVFATATLKDMLQLQISIQKKNGILLFTATGENWSDYKTEFEAFLAIHQD